MKIFEMLWWFFDIGNEPTSPDVIRKKPPEQNESAVEPEISESSIGEAEYDEFFD